MKALLAFFSILFLGLQVLHAEQEPLETLREHEHFVRTFTVTNPYERAIRVEKTDTSCTCIEFKLAKKFLLPGESTTLSVRVDNVRSSGLRKYKIWLYVTDPEYAAIEIRTKWIVSPDIAVDLIKNSDPAKRPDNHKYRDIYRYITSVKPDEDKRLKKYIRLSTPDKLEGGLQVTTAYEGNIWKFETKQLDPKSVLIIAKAKNPGVKMDIGLFTELLNVTTNHPKKSTFSLQFNTNVDTEAGNKEQAKTDFAGPPPPKR